MLLALGTARAQELVAGGLAPALEMRSSGVSVISPVATEKDRLDLGLAVGYGRQPLLVAVGSGLQAPLVTDAVALNALASYGVFEHFDVGLGVPFYVLTAGADGTPGRLNSTVAALGDIRVEPSYRIWGLDSGLLEVGAALGVALPTGDQARYAGAGLHGHARVAAVVRPLAALELLGNAGVLDGADAMGSFTWGAAGLYALGRGPFTLLAELDGRQGYEEQKISSLDARAGVRFMKGAWVAQAAPSFALLSATGHARFGAWLAVGHSLQMPKLPRASDDDDDRDGFANAKDACRTLAEDRDGFEDGDGCPDLDDDGDGIVDRFDQAPRDPEDRDGVADHDGVPDLEPLEHAQAEPPPPVPVVHEEALDRDADGDLVADTEDPCPAQPGPASNRGCPAQTRAVLTDSTIEITTRIEFALDAATLSADAGPLLDQVASLIEQHPELPKLRIEGHADLRGESGRNLELSQQRANVVLRALVDRGVAQHRLEAVGYGSRRPLVIPELTDAHRTQNRRVEFHIVHTDEEKP